MSCPCWLKAGRDDHVGFGVLVGVNILLGLCCVVRIESLVVMLVE